MKKNFLFFLLACFSLSAFAQNQIQLLKDFHNGLGGSYSVYEVFEWKEKGLAFITMSEPETGHELYVTDGTTEGTFLLKDINLGEYGSGPDNFCVVGDFVYFRAFEPVAGNELWRTDGTTEGTVLVEDLNPLMDALSEFHSGALNNRLFFAGNVESSIGLELCVSDGTENGTQLFLNINPMPDGHSTPNNFVEFGNKLYFTASDGLNGRELWVTDGTVDGTQMFLDIIPGGGSGFPYILGVCGGYMYFTATTVETGAELWVTDGTLPGTVMVKDISEGTSSSGIDPEKCACFDDKFYFVCNDWINGYELWNSDGTGAGTSLFKDFNTEGGDYASNIDLLTVVNNKLYLRANTSPFYYSTQVFESLGTPESTVVYNDMPVEEMSNIQELISCNDRLFIYAEYPQYFRLLSAGSDADDFVFHSGEGLNYIDEESNGSFAYFFTVGETLCFLGDFNTGIGSAWYSLHYDGGTKVADNNIDNQILTYPNPATNNFTVDPQSESDYSLIISDISGKVIIKYDSLNGINDIDLTNFQSGICLVKTNINGIVKTNKLLITK